MEGMPIVGYRIWRVYPTEMILRSINWEPWGSGTKHAEHVFTAPVPMWANTDGDSIHSPCTDCQCGLHAFGETLPAQHMAADSEIKLREKAKKRRHKKLFAMKTKKETFFADSSLREHFASSKYISGAVIGWGKVILHDKGFRSEYMKIIALVPSDTNREIVSPLANKLQISMVEDNRLVEFSTEFGESFQRFLERKNNV